MAYAPEPAASEVADERTVIDVGHVDAVAPRLVNGAFRTLFKDSRTSDVVWREPGSVIMHLTAKGRQTIPDPADGLSFIGAPGDVFYSIPQTQDPALLWAGWSTEAFQSTDIQGNFTMSLDKVEGPGELLIFEWTPFGEPMMRFDTRDGLPDTYEVPARTHEHANWVFTQDGVYRMTFTYKATLGSGEEVSDSQVFTMAVGDVDLDEVSLPGDGGSTVGGATGGGSADGGSTTGGSTDGGSSEGGSTGGDSSNGGSADGGSTGGGSTSGGPASGGAADGGGTAAGGSTSGGATSGGSADGGSTTGGTTDGGSMDGGAADGGSADGGSTGGGSTAGDSTSGGSGTGGSTAGGSTGGTTTGGPAGGKLADTGAGMAIPLGVGGAALLGVGAGTSMYLYRRKSRGTSGTTPGANAS
ncbi:choice-of-anchor M domain-containing protein [Streptomyces sp. LaPpAH-108]|uniref:choice-of-anchor M domain-containing protein n=1 Tax=Streptomyces sp. LaPpAH-108 TaxID=1155714 RepID=UPI001319DF21|nr:choice-of-anchor M domain-containing protein [Streptomyces sp. LaPpAH-108]